VRGVDNNGHWDRFMLLPITSLIIHGYCVDLLGFVYRGGGEQHKFSFLKIGMESGFLGFVNGTGF
jgi:hypothetical protein